MGLLSKVVQGFGKATEAIKKMPSEFKLSLGEERLLGYAKKYLEVSKPVDAKDGAASQVEMLRSVQKFSLTESGGTVGVLIRDKIDVLFELKFAIQSVDWKKDQSIHLIFSEKAQSASAFMLVRWMVNLLLGFKSRSASGFLKSALAAYPYCQVVGNDLIIQIGQVPEIKEYFEKHPVLSSLKNFAGVTQLNHKDKALEVGLGWVG